MSIRDQILSANDRTTAKVDVPEWGCGHVYVRSLSAAELRGYQAAIKSMDNQALKEGLLAATIICDEQGNRIFTDDDASALAGKNAKVLDRIAAAFSKLNALDPDEVKDIEKKS